MLYYNSVYLTVAAHIRIIHSDRFYGSIEHIEHAHDSSSLLSNFPLFSL